MKKRLSVALIAVILLVSLVGCSANDPLQETVYFGGDPPMLLVGDGQIYVELRPDLDFETVRANGKPTQVTRGIVNGFSLPIYAADNEELFLEQHCPNRWNESSDIIVHVHCYLDTANVDKRFSIQMSWQSFSDGDVVPDTSNPVVVETQTGNAAQYQLFHLTHIIDYDIVPAYPLVSSDEIHLRIRRIAASADEITGEVVITHVGLVFQRDKLGSSVP